MPKQTKQTAGVFLEFFANRSGRACNRCKKHHKKCDQLLPYCTRCSESGVNCCYSNDEKALVKESKTHHHQAATTQHLNNSNDGEGSSESSSYLVKVSNPSINSTFNGLVIRVPHILMFFDDAIEEIIPLSKIKKMTNELEEINVVERSFLYSIQGFVEQRSGSTELAEISFQHARLLLTSQFNNFSNLTIGVSLVYFSCYTFAMKRYSQTFLYTNLVNYFIHSCEESREKQNLVKWFELFKLGMNFTLTYEKKGALGIVETFPQILSTLFSINFVDMNDEALYQYIMNLEQCLERHIKHNLLRERFMSELETQSRDEIIKTMISIGFSGYKLAYMACFDPNNTEVMWKLASSILSHTKKPYFKIIPHLILPMVDFALAQQTKLALEMNCEDKCDKVFVLMDNLKLIQELNSRFERVDFFYENVEKKLLMLVDDHAKNLETFLNLDPNSLKVA